MNFILLIFFHLSVKLIMGIIRLNKLRRFTAGDGSSLREILNPRRQKIRTSYSLAWARVKPGRATTLHALKYSEVYYILKGRGLIRIDNRTIAVRSRDTVYISPRAVQSIKNTGRSDLEFLCIVSPAWEPACEKIIRKPSN
jgi:mannose-6-phosphate isomerase-like protein (cupin superfamily)